MFVLKQLLDGLPEKETVTFFAVFARFEYAMMQQRLILTNRGGGAEPDWSTLARQLGGGFLARAAETAPTIINEPPRKLIVQDGLACFGAATPPAASTTQLLEHVRQVRNNLFHGNKMFATNRDRDRILMVEAVRLLDLIMDEVPELRWSFSEPQG